MDILVSPNDYPAGSALSFGSGSTSAHKMCKLCDADRRTGNPCSCNTFLGAFGKKSRWSLRTLEQITAAVQEATALGKTAREKKLKDAGLYMPEFPYYALMDRCAARPDPS
jgi:hypothetical protein